MTRISRKLTACVFILIILGLGVLSLQSFANYGLKDNLNPVTGELARDVESHYDDGFPVRSLGTNLWAAINYLLFREGRPGVTIGEQGWLFSDEELYPGVEDTQVVETNLNRVVSVANYLKGRGIPLVILAVPAKARVYQEKLGEHRPAPVMTSLYPEFMNRMRSAGVFAPNLLPELTEARDQGAQIFLRTDTHWTPRGADVFARSAASEIKASFKNQPWGETKFVTTLGETHPHRGDLLNYLPLTPLFPKLGPSPDQLTERSTDARSTGSGSEQGLFSNTSTDLVLVGTSYSANPLWNFPGALKHYLGRDLINVSHEGQGPFQPMVDYLQSDEFRNHTPSLLVWEFPERYLAQPVDDDKTLAWLNGHGNLVARMASQEHQTTHEGAKP
jgi:alginate O-acetyltransferase complex protein AlgJ